MNMNKISRRNFIRASALSALGAAAALRCAEEGLDTICCEVQTWEEYDNYACDLTTYNSKFFLDKGAEKYDPMDIFTEYMVKALGHANQKIVKDYATRSGEALDWMLAELDPDYVAKYAHAVNYKGNKHFQNPCSHSYYYVGMTQWRDTGTETNTNNMWPYTVRLLQQKAVEKGCEDKFWQGAAAGMDVLVFGLCACTKLDGMETTNTGDLSVYLAHSADYEQITVSTVPAEKTE